LILVPLEENAMKKLMTLFALMMLLPATALAESECSTDADCPEGSFCITGGMTDCACPPCDPDDGECPDCNCPDPTEVMGYCDSFEIDFGQIVAGECASDSDCPLDFVCQEVDVPCDTAPPCACACEPCPEDDPACDPKCDECECPEPEPCSDETQQLCVFSPTECTADADCADGFVCEAIEECYGSGSSGCVCGGCVCPTCMEGEECPPCDCPEDPVCECEDEPESFEECITVASICFPEEVVCETDADCAEDFICFDVGDSEENCVCAGCDCAPCPEGEECEPCDCPPCECGDLEGDPELMCIPAGWDEAGFLGGGDVSMGEAMGSVKGENDDTATPQSPEDGENDPNANLSGDGAEKAADDTRSESTGCTAGHNTNAAPAGLLFLLVFGLAILRRRASDVA
jgi:Cys-rich repeat protein